MSTCWQNAWDLVKLMLPLGVALMIAKLTVGWALERYKAEKVWERRLTAYADATIAIAAMRRIVGQWYDEAVQDRHTSEEATQAQRERHQAARRALDDGIATARLILPATSVQILSSLDRDLAKCRDCDSYEEHLDCEWAVLDKVLTGLIAEGRRVLDMP